MGERAKKKRAAEAKAARNSKAKKATEVSSELEEGPTSTNPTTSNIKLPTGTRSKAKKTVEQVTQLMEDPASTDPTSSDIRLPTQSKNFLKKGAAAPRVPSSASTRHSTRSIKPSSKLGSGEKHTSVKGHDDESIATRPKRSATAAANALLQQLQITSEIESTDFEDPNGECNDEINMRTKY
jgi:hypothetical protein